MKSTKPTKPAPTEWVYCAHCAADREKEHLEHDCCPICGNLIEEAGQPDPLAIPDPVQQVIEAMPEPQKKQRKTLKPTTPDMERLSAEEEAYRLPYSAPTGTVEDNIQRELAKRVLCRRKLMPFIQRFRPKYLPGWVHEDICRRLERFVEQVEQGLSPRLLLMMPPRGGKSEIGSRNFPPWVLGKHPEWEIIAASHTSSLTMSFSRYVRDLLLDPAYTSIFPGTQLDPQSRSVENWNITGGGGYLAAGVGTGITGRGAHILLLDDLVKDIEAADSQTIRDNTWEWYISTAYTRLAPGGGVLGIMTWWHDDDWAGRIQQVMAEGEGDQFEIVKYPAINDEGDEYILEDDTIVQWLEQEPPVPPPATAIMTREKGTALHPARYTTDMMLKIKRNLIAAGQQRIWNALYQQNPLPDEGILFKKEQFRYYATLPQRERCYVYQAWDFAITEGQENDYTVGMTIYQDECDNLYVADVRRFRSGDSFVIVDEILDFAKEWDVDFLGFEDGQIWKAMESVYERRCQERRQYPSYETLKPLTDKLVRAAPLRGRMQLGKVYFPENADWFRNLFLELTRFPNVKHDDQVDSLAWAVRLTLSQSAPQPLKSKLRTKKPKSWKEKLKGLTGGNKGGSHMAA